MKDLLSEEHCCYKTHGKSSAYPPPPPPPPPPPHPDSIDNPLCMDYLPFLEENLESTFYDFHKSRPPYQWGGFTLWQVLI